MPGEDWEIVFQEFLARCAHAVAAELKDVDPEAAEWARTFAALSGRRFYCPECWVRYRQARTLHQKRWLASCDEHHYKLPPP